MSITISKRSGVVAVLVASVVLLAAEGSVRALEPQLMEPGSWGDLETQRKVEQIDRLAASGGADVVFYGSSIVDVGMDPQLYSQLSPPETVVYNAALSASSPRLLELWSREIVLPHLQPELVVIGLSSRELNDHGISQTEQYDRYAASIGRAFELGQPSMPQRLDRAFSDVSAVVRLRSVIRRPYSVFNQLRGTAQQDLQLTDQGAVTGLRTMNYRVSEVFRERIVNNSLIDYAIGGVELEALGRLIDGIRATGAEVLLVDMPVLEADYVPMHPNGQADLDQYRTVLDRFAAEYDVQLATPDNAPWQSSEFADPLHLTQSGSDSLTTWVWEIANDG